MKKILFYIVFISVSLHAQTEMNLVDIMKYTIKSTHLEMDRDYWVSLPSDYDSANTYPVIYVLDAEVRFSIINALEKELSTYGKIPPHIVVGITHPNRKLDMTFSTTKVRRTGQMDTITYSAQNSGNGSEFLNFIEKELVAEVNLKYSTNGFNILIGHSIGGYFCSYIMPTQKSFSALQIYDPSLWYSSGEAIDQIKNNLSREAKYSIFLSSSHNFEHQFTYHHKKMKELDRALKRFPAIRHEYKNYENEHHNSMYLHSFLDGMSMLYDGYELQLGDWQTKISTSSIEKHFEQFSEMIQFDFKPPMHLYLTAGMNNFYQKKYANCVEALTIYLNKNPHNAYALELMGDAYYYLQEKEQSLMFYKKALERLPGNDRLKQKIEE